MLKILATAAAVVVCAGPALAEPTRSARDCYEDPETTGSLPPDPRSLLMPGERPSIADADPPEGSWQTQARETAEQRRQDLLNCGVD